MSLSSQLVGELKARAGQGGDAIAVADGPRTVRCTASQCDRFAASVEELVLLTVELAGAPAARLQAAALSLSERVNYLLEPIAPIESDAEGCSVQMRSSPPQKDDNGRCYYELVLNRGGSVALCRYEKHPGQPRVRVAAVLTHEVIGRLVDDFCATVDAM